MCDYTCTKYLVFFFNFLFWILGLVIIVIGAWAAADKEFIAHFGFDMNDDLADLAETLQMLAIALIVLGTIIMVIGFFGCCGAIKENQCCLGTFFLLLFICFLATVAIGGILMFFAISGSDDDRFKKHFEQAADALWAGLGKEAKKDFEMKHKCCGSKSNFDKDDLSSLAGSIACAGKDSSWLTGAGISNKGCLDALLDEIKANIIIAGAVMLGIAVIEILGMSMACLLCCGIKRAYAAV